MTIFDLLNGTGKVTRHQDRHSALEWNMRNNMMNKQEVINVVRRLVESPGISRKRR